MGWIANGGSRGDSPIPSLRQFLSIALDESTPDHVTISRTSRLIDTEIRQQIFSLVPERLAQSELIKGKIIAVDSTTLEANAAMKSTVRRDADESYTAYLRRLAGAEKNRSQRCGSIAEHGSQTHQKKTSNEDWKHRIDEAAEITKLKDGRTALAYKAENQVDMEIGAIVAVTTPCGAAADTTTVTGKVIEAGIAVAGLVAAEWMNVKPAEGRTNGIRKGTRKWLPTSVIAATMCSSDWHTASAELHGRTRSRNSQLDRPTV